MKRCQLTVLALTLIFSACSNATTKSSTDLDISGLHDSETPTSGIQMIMSTTTSSPEPTGTMPPILTSSPDIATPASIAPTQGSINNNPSGLWEVSTAPIQVDHNLCENSAYIEDASIPDGTVLAPGEIFVKSWVLENTGFCTWKDSYMLMFYEGDPMSGQNTEINKTIASGRQAKISIELTAPNSEGTYTGYWIMANQYGTPFGMPFYVQIIVINE